VLQPASTNRMSIAQVSFGTIAFPLPNNIACHVKMGMGASQ
jgi:hypothetical protein